MGDEKYAKALDKLIDAKDEIVRLRAELDEAREVVQTSLPYIPGALKIENT